MIKKKLIRQYKLNKEKSVLPEAEIYDKLGNKLKGTFKKVNPTSPVDEIFYSNRKPNRI